MKEEPTPVRSNPLLVLALSLALALAGCATSPPARFYVLAPADLQPEGAPLRDLVLGVGPVRLADHLERPQLVSRDDGNRLQVEEFERWGGTLDANILWVLAENLSRGLGTGSVVTYPWERALNPRFQVVLDIREFEPVREGDVRLTALWRVLARDGEALLAVEKSVITEPVAGSSPASRVDAQSRALARLSTEIAAAVRRLAPRAP